MLRDHVNQRLGNPPWKPTKANDLTNGSSAAASNVVTTYDYRDEHGQLVYQVVRKQPKAFSQRRPDPDKPGEWVWNLKGITRLPYRLPELLAAGHDAVFIVEGEKDADALTDRAYVATCNSGGAGNWTPDLNTWFSGKTAYIIPDDDEAGHKHAQQVAENLYGIAREIRIVDLPGLPDKKGADFSDWLEASGGDTSKLIDIAKAAPVWAPSSSELKDGKKNRSRIGSAAELRGKRFPALKYIVPEILAEGCTLIAGRPKLGKSWLMLDIGIAVAAGRYCLGESKCEQGDVLYLALEDNERRLQRRITKILGAFSTEWPTEFQYATEWPRVNEGGVEEIRKWIVSAKILGSLSWTCWRCLA